MKEGIDELFQELDTIDILGIHSEFINSLEDSGEFINSLEDNSRYKCHNYTDKIKQTKIAKEIKKINTKFHLLLLNLMTISHYLKLFLRYLLLLNFY